MKLALLALALGGCSLALAGDLGDAREPAADAGPPSTSNEAGVLDALADATAPKDTSTATDAYSAAVLEDAPIAYWRLEEPSGATFHDEVGGHDLTLSETTDVGYAVPGVGGSRAVHLTGGVSLSVSGVFSTATNTDFSIEAWVKRGFTNTRYGIVFEKNTVVEGIRDGMVLWVNPGRDIGSAFEVWGDQTVREAALGAPIPTTTFTHFVFTRTLGKGRLYVNGGETGETSANTVIPDSNPTITWGDAFAGELDELAIYDRALSPARISAHLAAGN